MSGPRWFWKCDIVSHFTVYPTISISLYVFSVEAVWVTVSPKKSTDPQSMLLYCGINSRPTYLHPQYSVVALCKIWAILDFFNVGWQYSDRKNSFNDFAFLFGNSLTNSLTKKVNRSTKHVTLLWKKRSPNISISPIFRCGFMQNLGNFSIFQRCVTTFWKEDFIQWLPFFVWKQFD